jgi:hypothetical protein
MKKDKTRDEGEEGLLAWRFGLILPLVVECVDQTCGVVARACVRACVRACMRKGGRGFGRSLPGVLPLTGAILLELDQLLGDASRRGEGFKRFERR